MTSDANPSNWALRVLKYLNCLHEPCVAAIVATDCVGKWPNQKPK